MDIGVRAAAAIVGGYVVAAVSTAFLALYLPLARSEATAAATLLSFVVYTVAAIGSFTASSALKAWGGLGAAAAIMTAIMLIFGGAA